MVNCYCLNFLIVRNYIFKIKKDVFNRLFILFIGIYTDSYSIFFVTLNKNNSKQLLLAEILDLGMCF
jgi:hypothetical protein